MYTRKTTAQPLSAKASTYSQVAAVPARMIIAASVSLALLLLSLSLLAL